MTRLPPRAVGLALLAFPGLVFSMNACITLESTAG